MIWERASPRSGNCSVTSELVAFIISLLGCYKFKDSKQYRNIFENLNTKAPFNNRFHVQKYAASEKKKSNS